MGRKVLFLACCHHMHELLAKDTCYKIFPKDDSPQCKLFMDLKRELDLFQRRHDYKELLEVSLKLHGPSCQQEFTWKKVGAVNKARFMAWSLCSVKAFAFSSGLLQGNQGKPAMLHSLPSHNLHSSHPDVQYLI